MLPRYQVRSFYFVSGIQLRCPYLDPVWNETGMELNIQAKLKMGINELVIVEEVPPDSMINDLVLYSAYG